MKCFSNFYVSYSVTKIMDACEAPQPFLCVNIGHHMFSVMLLCIEYFVMFCFRFFMVELYYE